MSSPMQYADEVPQGSAGLANGVIAPTVEQVGSVYANTTEGAVTAAMSKRDADWADLSGVANIANEGTHTA